MNSSLQRVINSSFTLWLLLGLFSVWVLFWKNPIRESVRFGIDLVGGTYITLGVQTQKALDAQLVSKMQSLTENLKSANKAQPTTRSVDNGVMTLVFENMAAAQDAAQQLKTQDAELVIDVKDRTLLAHIAERQAAKIEDDAVKRIIEVLKARLDNLSVAEIPIAQQGKDRIVVELPDVSDPQQAKARIGKAAILEFKIVEKVGKSSNDLLYELDGELPDDMQILAGREEGGDQQTYYLVSKYAELSGQMLKDAQAGLGGKTTVEPIVSFTFNSDGRDKLSELTTVNHMRRLAIVLDDVVILAPQIREPINGGTGQITGLSNIAEAKELALLLRSGSFVAPVTFEEERQIGPTLGAESIRQGLVACLVSLAILFVFSILVYHMAGFFAFLALVFNLLLLLLGLSWLGATLTLPGIAGMVLTVGMAIDASILIYEHIREELKKGLTLRRAVNEGFSGAMSVILDANITTFIVGVVLYKFGTGPIQGFAVTMMLGIITTLITGLFFLRSLFSFILDNFNIQKLKI